MNNVKIFFFILCLPSLSSAAFEPIDCGEEFFRGANSVYLNPASLPEYSSATFDYTRPFGIAELQFSRVSFNLYNFVAGLSSFGNAVYNEYEILLGYKFSLKRANLGGDIRGRFVSVDNYGSRFSLALDIGISTHFRDNIMLDGVLQSSSKRVLVGFHIHPIENAHLMLHLCKELSSPLGFRIGEILQVSPTLFLIFGINTICNSFTLGTLFDLEKLRIGYLIRTHATLGTTHIVSLGYGF